MVSVVIEFVIVEITEPSRRHVDQRVLCRVATDLAQDDIEELQREESTHVAPRSSCYRYKLESQAVTPNDAVEVVFQVVRDGIAHSFNVTIPRPLSI
ncbi:MAG: hypothetical protein JO020_32580 [Chloroflexi bacterium]|nr:hypothetical protein [Chloroflexota bacterium]